MRRQGRVPSQSAPGLAIGHVHRDGLCGHSKGLLDELCRRLTTGLTPWSAAQAQASGLRQRRCANALHTCWQPPLNEVAPRRAAGSTSPLVAGVRERGTQVPQRERATWRARAPDRAMKRSSMDRCCIAGFALAQSRELRKQFRALKRSPCSGFGRQQGQRKRRIIIHALRGTQ